MEGRFPCCSQVLPEISDEARVVTLNAKLLKQLADAVCHYGESGVTLLFNDETSVVAVMPSNGGNRNIGAIMPLHSKGQTRERDIATYNERRKEILNKLPESL